MPRRKLDLSSGQKRCPQCKETKPLAEFHPSNGTQHGYNVYCKPCCSARHDIWRRQNLPKMREASKKWREENPRLSKDHKLRSTYGIPLGTYERLLATQQGKCAICRTDKAGGAGDFHLDHCHDRRTIRGLLCHHCNVGLGHFQHRTDLLQAAITYLQLLSKSTGEG